MAWSHDMILLSGPRVRQGRRRFVPGHHATCGRTIKRGVAAERSAQRGTSGAATGGGGRSAPDPNRLVKRLIEAGLNSRKKVFADGVGLLEKRVAVNLEDAYADLGVLLE